MKRGDSHGGAGSGRRSLPAVWLALLMLAAPPAARAEQVVLGFDVHTPRSFGYLVGDLVSLRVVFELADTHALREDSLPKADRVSRWLVLDAPRLERSDGWSSTRYELTLDYRLVGAPAVVTNVSTPSMTLDVEGPGDGLSLAIPAWTFSVGPLVVEETRVEGVAQTLRPALPPPLIDHDARLRRMTVLGVAALLVLGYLSWLHLRVPWWRASNGPFARAARDLRRLVQGDGDDEAARRALTRVHRAFDETAGRTLFEADLAGFFEQNPHFAPMRDAIGGFYAESRAVFFIPGETRGASSVDSRSLRRLCLACRDAERGVA